MCVKGERAFSTRLWDNLLKHSALSNPEMPLEKSLGLTLFNVCPAPAFSRSLCECVCVCGGGEE